MDRVAPTANNARMLYTLLQEDPDIVAVVAGSKFVVVYQFQMDGPESSWEKANIKGSVYIIRRRTAPVYQLFVQNQFSRHDLLDNIHPDWRLQCQSNYVFYTVEDPSKNIRG